jgi:hypothetical protein
MFEPLSTYEDRVRRVMQAIVAAASGAADHEDAVAALDVLRRFLADRFGELEALLVICEAATRLRDPGCADEVRTRLSRPGNELLL